MPLDCWESGLSLYLHNFSDICVDFNPDPKDRHDIVLVQDEISRALVIILNTRKKISFKLNIL